MKAFFVLLFFILFISHSQAKNLVPNSFSASFEETIYKSSIGKETKSFGKMDYKFPGNLRREITSPEEEATVFVVNPEKSWFYRAPFMKGEMGEVTIQKSSKLPMIKILDSLKGDLENSKLFSTKYAGKELLITFNPAMQKESSVKTVSLLSSKEAKSVQSLKEFEGFTIHYLDGRKVSIKFIDMKEDVNLPAANFVFAIPDKTRVTTN